jgi:hypothetical protein
MGAGKRKAAQGGLLQEPVMALLVLWLLIYFLVDLFRGVGLLRDAPVPGSTALAVLPDSEAPISVDWELLPDVDEAFDRH